MKYLVPYRLIESYEPYLPFVYQEGFLTADECDQVIESFQRHQDKTAKPGEIDPFFENRIMWMEAVPHAELSTKCIMQRSRDRCVETIRQFYDEKRRLYADSVQIVRWNPGVPMPPHADNAFADGSPHPTPWRDYASVIYLNDDFQGGELFVVPLGIKVKPRKGLMIAFRGDFSHEHGVCAVRKGVRYTMPAWYSADEKTKNPDYSFDFCRMLEGHDGQVLSRSPWRAFMERLLNRCRNS